VWGYASVPPHDRIHCGVAGLGLLIIDTTDRPYHWMDCFLLMRKGSQRDGANEMPSDPTEDGASLEVVSG